LCSLEQEGGMAVLRGHILSSNIVIKVWHSLDLWFFQDNWELRSNHDDVNDLQVGRSSRKRPEFPTCNSELDDRSNVFSQSEFVFSEFPVVFNAL
jgi:hypothetical protein